MLVLFGVRPGVAQDMALPMFWGKLVFAGLLFAKRLFDPRAVAEAKGVDLQEVIDAMIAAGIVDEVRALRARGIPEEQAVAPGEPLRIRRPRGALQVGHAHDGRRQVEAAPDQPAVAEQLFDLVRMRVRRDVEILRAQAQQQIAYRSAG